MFKNGTGYSTHQDIKYNTAGHVIVNVDTVTISSAPTTTTHNFIPTDKA